MGRSKGGVTLSAAAPAMDAKVGTKRAAEPTPTPSAARKRTTFEDTLVSVLDKVTDRGQLAAVLASHPESVAVASAVLLKLSKDVPKVASEAEAEALAAVLNGACSSSAALAVLAVESVPATEVAAQTACGALANALTQTAWLFPEHAKAREPGARVKCGNVRNFSAGCVAGVRDGGQERVGAHTRRRGQDYGGAERAGVVACTTCT